MRRRSVEDSYLETLLPSLASDINIFRPITHTHLFKLDHTQTQELSERGSRRPVRP